MASTLMSVLGVLSRIEPLQPVLNRIAINLASGRSSPRPLPYATWTPDRTIPVGEPYVTWPGLVDRRYTGRHLPPAQPARPLPPVAKVVDLFMRPTEGGQDRMTPSSRTTILFCFFAQWFTDSFLRTFGPDKRLNTSNHEIDLCQIYGLTAETAFALRERQGGRMRVEVHATGEYPPRLYDAAGTVRPEFAELGGPSTLFGAALDPSKLSYPVGLRAFLRQAMRQIPEPELTARIDAMYATGLERGSNTILYAAFNALFLREHNRLAGVLAKANPGWDDHRLFETARNINIVQCLKLVIEEYIQHLAGLPLQFRLDGGFAEKQTWYRTNRIAIEFNLLYRWHPLIPNTLTIGGRTLDPDAYRWNNALLEQIGLEPLFEAASLQPAGRMMLHNTPAFMRGAEQAAIELARQHNVQPFNAYRKCFGFEPYRTHEELTGDTVLAAELRALYPNVDDVEFQVGLFAEFHDTDSSFGALLGGMVAVDAFSQVFTNPLLAKEVHDLALGVEGKRIVTETNCLQDIVARNAPPGAAVLAKFRLPRTA